MWTPESPALAKHDALVDDALAASQGQAPPPPAPPEAYRGISAADTVGKEEAKMFLKQEMAAWYAQPHPRGPLRADITSGTSASSQGQFYWPYFVQRREWFREHFVGYTITAFEVVRSDRHGHAVFLGCRSDGRMFTVNPWARNQEAELSWCCDNAEIF